MIAGFQSFSDSNGNLWVADGWVSQLRSGMRIAVGTGQPLPPLLRAPDGSRFMASAAASGGTFVGGSGRNLTSTGLTPSLSGPPLPVGIWTPRRPNVWALSIFTLTVTGLSAATISDGTNDVAILTAGGTAPVGSFVATSYGQTTYNSGSAFTLAVAAEAGGPGIVPSYAVSISVGTARADTYAPSSAIDYAAAGDANWTILVNSDGSADLKHSGTTIATRAAGSDCEPGGVFEANSTGQTTYNSGNPWRAFVQVMPAAVRAGFGYLTVTEVAGVLSTVAGPFFATALPSDTSTVFHPAIVLSDGLGGISQIISGPLIWPG